jgi:tRNA1(Val) A37 N6-methylase TrmN6
MIYYKVPDVLPKKNEYCGGLLIRFKRTNYTKHVIRSHLIIKEDEGGYVEQKDYKFIEEISMGNNNNVVWMSTTV